MGKERAVLIFVAIICAIAVALIYYPQTTQSLAQRLVSADTTTRYLAQKQLFRLADAEQANLTSDLTAVLRHDDPREVRLALYTLRSMKSRDQTVGEKSIRLLRHPNPNVRKEAEIFVLASGTTAVKPLVNQALEHEDSDGPEWSVVEKWAERGAQPLGDLLIHGEFEAQRRLAAKWLANLGPAAKNAHPALVQAIKSPHVEVRLDSALALVNIHGDKSNVADLLGAALKETRDDILIADILSALARGGAGSKETISAVTKILLTGREGFGEGPYTRPLSAAALENLQPRDRSDTAMSWDLRQPSEVTRYRAAYVLSMRDNPRPLTSFLVGALDDSSFPVRARAAAALARVGLENARRHEARIIRAVLRDLKAADSDPNVMGYENVAVALLSGAERGLVATMEEGVGQGLITSEQKARMIAMVEKTKTQDRRPSTTTHQTREQ